MIYSLLDNENDLIKRSDKQVENMYRLGSLFCVWYCNEKSYNYNNPVEDCFSLKKLEEITKEIDWIDIKYHSDSELKIYPYYYKICEKISKLLLNYSLRNNIKLYKDIINNNFKDNEVRKIDNIEEYLYKYLQNICNEEFEINVRIQRDCQMYKISAYINVSGVGKLILKFKNIFVI